MNLVTSMIDNLASFIRSLDYFLNYEVMNIKIGNEIGASILIYTNFNTYGVKEI